MVSMQKSNVLIGVYKHENKDNYNFPLNIVLFDTFHSFKNVILLVIKLELSLGNKYFSIQYNDYGINQYKPIWIPTMYSLILWHLLSIFFKILNFQIVQNNK